MGYNNICYDDEMICYIFFCNFFDFYEYSYKNGNLCWDLLDVVWVCYVLCLDGINWVIDEEGIFNFKLENFIKVNGIEYENVYDVMVDVYVIIVMMKLFKEK